MKLTTNMEKLGGVDASTQSARQIPFLGVCMPCCDEEKTISPSYENLSALLVQMEKDGVIADWMMVFVDDGSTDGTWNEITRIHNVDTHVRGVRFSRNFGQQPAVLAGYAFCIEAGCDAVVSLDVDLQDDIAIIPDMVTHYMAGCDIVFGCRHDRTSDKAGKRLSAALYYRLAKSMDIPGPYDCAEFRLMSKAAIDTLASYPEHDVYLRGMTGYMGLKSETVTYTRKAREQGETSYTMKKMFSLASSGILSFTTKPLVWVSRAGFLFCLIAVALSIWTIVTFARGDAISGWSSLMISVWFASGAIMLSIGVIGKYLGEVLKEAKHRPRFIVSERL